MMYLLEKLDQQRDAVVGQLEKLGRVRKWLQENQFRFESLPTATIYGEFIDFDSLAHDQIMKVVMGFGGKWNRTPNGERLDYVCKINDDVTIRCWSGQPPPNCRIVYEEVRVPEHTERRPKFVCNSTANALPAPKQELPEITSPLEIPF